MPAVVFRIGPRDELHSSANAIAAAIQEALDRWIKDDVHTETSTVS